MKLSALFAGAALVVACGGGSYYIIQNPATGQSYYTTKYETLDNGAIKLTDAKTQQVVTLPSSTIQKVDESEYNAKLHAAQANPPPTAGTAPTAPTGGTGGTGTTATPAQANPPPTAPTATPASK